MIGQKETYYRFILGYRSREFFLFFALMTTAFLLACSNSQSPETDNPFSQDDIEQNLFSSEQPASSSSTSASSTSQQSESSSSKTPASSSSIKEYLPLDDTEYPYAGLPRIVIETEKHRQILDRETEIPAKLQVWGKKAPESEILDLTIRGRGNSTWGAPKKPFLIKLNEKHSILGMNKAKKWVLLANYFDRTLIRNAVAFEIAKKTQLEWTPSGKFAEIYLNRKFLGNYYVCEKIQIKENRLNIGKNAYLLEFDSHYDEEYKFKSSIRELPINIKNPEIPSEDQQKYIQDYIDTVEKKLYANNDSLLIEDYLDLQSFADYLIVYELTQNNEPVHPKSAFMYKDEGKLKAGPVWDFDWGTFNKNKKGMCNQKALWIQKMLLNENFKNILKNNWNQYKKDFSQIPNFIDSLATYIKISNNRNINLWPIETNAKSIIDKDKSFDESIFMMREVFSNRISELDSIFNNQ